MSLSLNAYGLPKLREGMNVDFFVRNQIVLQDNKTYFILEDPSETKHFIEADPYHHYQIQSGQKLRCQIVKINCTGRIILEPTHPVYKIGESYEFRLLPSDSIDQENCYLLEDVFGNLIKITKSDKLFPIGNPPISIRCIIKSIKKGIPEFEI